jgi:hypothetical protein
MVSTVVSLRSTVNIILSFELFIIPIIITGCGANVTLFGSLNVFTSDSLKLGTAVLVSQFSCMNRMMYILWFLVH